MKLNWTEFLESYSRYPSVLLLLLATNTETNPATASSKTTPPPSAQLLVLLRIKSAAEKASTASTSAHHNVRRFFFIFFSLISLFLWGADRNANFVLVHIGMLVEKKNKTTTTKTQRSFRLISNCWTIPTQKNLDFWYYATTTIKLPGNLGPKNMPISLLKAINACPFDWNKCWCAARAVSSCWVVHLSKSVPSQSDLRGKGSVSDRLWVSAGLRIMGACSEQSVYVCVCDQQKKKWDVEPPFK